MELTDTERVTALESEYRRLDRAARAVVAAAAPTADPERVVLDAVELVRLRRLLAGEPAPSSFQTMSIT
jgi:hypothetical protein